MSEPRPSAIHVRPAVDVDRPDVLRLVAAMYAEMHGVYGGEAPGTDPGWEADVAAALDRRIGADVAVFVVDGANGRPASVAVGRISETLPSPRREHRLEGYVEWVSTDLEYRRSGYASAATARLLEWFRENGALSVWLNASPAAESMYAKMGFDADGPKTLSLRLDPM